MNLISETHYIYERREYVFIVLREYTIIFRITHSFIDNLHIKVELRVVAWLGLVENEDRGLENFNYFDYNWLLLLETIVILVLFRMM